MLDRSLTRRPPSPAPVVLPPQYGEKASDSRASLPPLRDRSFTTDHVPGSRSLPCDARLQHDAFNFVQGQRVVAPIVELRRPRRFVAGDLLGLLERAAVLQVAVMPVARNV